MWREIEIDGMVQEAGNDGDRKKVEGYSNCRSEGSRIIGSLVRRKTPILLGDSALNKQQDQLIPVQ